MIAVPLTALWIMPLLMLAALLAPLGVEGPVLWLAQFGLDGLLRGRCSVSRGGGRGCLLAPAVVQLEGEGLRPTTSLDVWAAG